MHIEIRPFSDRVCAEGRPHGPLFQYVDRCRQSTRAQHDGEILGFFQGEVAGNTGLAAGYLFLNYRCGCNGIIQYDRQPFVYVLTSDPFKNPCTLFVKINGHKRYVELVKVHACISQARTG